MPEVVAVQSGPQGRASDSWDILAQQPSTPKPEELGERKEGPEQSLVETEEPKTEERALTNGQKDEQQREEQDAEAKDKGQKVSRYERTKRQRAALEQREKAISEREKAFAEHERALSQRQEEANKPPYTIAELKQYRKVWNNPSHKDYDPDLVQKADSEIERLEKLEADSRQIIELPRSGTKEFNSQWQAAEKELYQLDPEFQREGTRLDKVLRGMMQGPDGAIYRQHPRGIVAAYHRARLDIAEADLGAARSEIQKLKNELARLTGLTSIGPSGGAGRSVGEMRGKDFANMSTKEMREHLKRNAQRERW